MHASGGNTRQLAAEKKLLKAEVASLKRQAAEHRKHLQVLLQESDKVRSVQLVKPLLLSD